MPTFPIILRSAECRSTSVYRHFGFSRTPEGMHELLSDPELALSLKFTATLAAFASLSCPLRLADFRAFVPDAFWQEHFRFSYVSALGGWVPIAWESAEWFYSLGMGPAQSPYGVHHVYFIASRELLPDDPFQGRFDPPLDTAVNRFALVHPFLQSEMHEDTGIYLFTSA